MHKLYARLVGSDHSQEIPAAEGDARLERRLFIVLCLCLCAHVAVRVFIPRSLGLDEAEQVIATQWLLPGYSAQPPLYTWLQWVVFHVVGLNVFALSVLKHILILILYVLYYLCARELLTERRLALWATASLLFIPQTAYEVHRDLTHSVLLVVLNLATFYAVLRLLRKPTTTGYAALGFVMGLGVLSKYNFLLFLLAVVVTLLTTAQGRRLLCDWRICLSIGIAVLISLPYTSWLLLHNEVALAQSRKLERVEGLGLIASALSFLWRLNHVVGVLLLVFLLCFAKDIQRVWKNRPAAPLSFPLGRYLGIALAVLLGVMLLTEASRLKERWMSPLLLLLPTWLFHLVREGNQRSRAWRLYLALAVTVAICVVGAMSARALALFGVKPNTKLAYPTRAIAAEARAHGFHGGVIVADSYVTAANLRMYFPDSAARAPDWNPPGIPPIPPGSWVLVVWDSRKGGAAPEGLRKFLMQTPGRELIERPVIRNTFALAGRKQNQFEVAMVVLPPEF